MRRTLRAPKIKVKVLAFKGERGPLEIVSVKFRKNTCQHSDFPML
jgi:hypothetical protein